MKIRITGSKPDKGQCRIDHLIGQIFDVDHVDEAGYYLRGNFLIKPDECEIVEGEGTE